MRKIVFALIALVVAVPALGSVVITATDEGGGNVAISYDATTEPNNVRAFALNITVTAGVIDDVTDYNVGESNSTAKGYGIFMGTIDINSDTGDVISYGSPVAPNDTPGALGGLDTNGITIELGSLYEDANAPLKYGTLCKVHVTAGCNLSVTAEDVHRGGVVLEDGSTVVPDLAGATDVPVSLVCECEGDMDDDGYVAFSDVERLITDLIDCDWFCIDGQPCWYDCGDFDDDGYMAFSDVEALITYLIDNDWFVICP